MGNAAIDVDGVGAGPGGVQGRPAPQPPRPLHRCRSARHRPQPPVGWCSVEVRSPRNPAVFFTTLRAVLPVASPALPPPCPPFATVIVTGPIVAGQSMSLSLLTNCELPPGYTFRWDYEGPGGRGFPLPLLPSAATFQPNVTARAPWWLPVTNHPTLEFGVRVQNPSGFAEGPLLGRVAVAAAVPSGPLAAQCHAASVRADAAQHLRCARDQPGGTAHYLCAHALPEVHACGASGPEQLLGLLHTLRGGFVEGLFGPTDAGARAWARGGRSMGSRDCEACGDGERGHGSRVGAWGNEVGRGGGGGGSRALFYHPPLRPRRKTRGERLLSWRLPANRGRSQVNRCNRSSIRPLRRLALRRGFTRHMEMGSVG